jgi:hypothetical protein
MGPSRDSQSEVLEKLEVACASDIQNAASGGNVQRIRRMFCNLRDVPNKEAALLKLLSIRPTNTWVEARIFALLLEDDVAEDRYRGDIAADLLFRR